jgi:hypothetical protein
MKDINDVTKVSIVNRPPNYFPDDEAPKDAVVVRAATADNADGVNTRLFTNDANTNNNVASGLLGLGVGVGGVLLAQAFLDSQKEKEPCHFRYRRDNDGVQGRFLGFGENNNKRPCPPHHPPPYPSHGGYNRPDPHYPPPAGRPGYQHPQQYPHARPPYQSGSNYQPHNSGYKQPSSGYRQPSNEYRQPSSGYRQPSDEYRQPSDGYRQPSNGYRQPSNGYRQSSDGYRQPAHNKPQYTARPDSYVPAPTPQYHDNNQYYPQSNRGYNPHISGRSLLPGNDDDKTASNDSPSTSELLGSGDKTGTKSDAVRFGDK